MADDNRVGIVGRVGQPQQPQQPQPQRGVPGVQQPPVPSSEQIQRVMAEQARQRQVDMAEAQRRAAALAAEHGKSTSESFSQGSSILSGHASQPTEHVETMIQNRPSRNESTNMSKPPVKQLKQFSEPEIEPKISISWYPRRSKGINVELEESIIECMPDDLAAEGDPQAKVVLALLAEVLYLRDAVSRSQSGGADSVANQELSARVFNLEQTMYAQRVSLQAQTRSVHEQVIEFQKQGLSPDQILARITGQQTEPKAGE